MRKFIVASIAAISLFAAAEDVMDIPQDGILWRVEKFGDGVAIRYAEPIQDEPEDESDLSDPAELETLKVPAVIGERKVAAIGEGAFAGMQSLREVRVADGPHAVESHAFAGCHALKSVKLPDSVVEIGEGAFRGCHLLKSVSLGDSVTNLPANVFSDCYSLSDMDLPKELANIGDGAFSGCTGIETLSIPRGVTNIGARAFFDCCMLTTVVFRGAEPAVGENAFANVDTKCYFRASSDAGWSVEIPGRWQDRKIVDLAIQTYRRAAFIYMPSVVGAVGTLAILVLAIVLRERRKEEDEDDF